MAQQGITLLWEGFIFDLKFGVFYNETFFFLYQLAGIETNLKAKNFKLLKILFFLANFLSLLFPVKYGVTSEILSSIFQNSLIKLFQPVYQHHRCTEMTPNKVSSKILCDFNKVIYLYLSNLICLTKHLSNLFKAVPLLLLGGTTFSSFSLVNGRDSNTSPSLLTSLSLPQARSGISLWLQFSKTQQTAIATYLPIIISSTLIYLYMNPPYHLD